MQHRVLIVGSGGREHALGWKLRQSPNVHSLYFAPGNGGTSRVGMNVAIAVDDIDRLVHFVKEQMIGLTVVGPEAPLAKGVVDAFCSQGLRIFGPTQAATRLESSKSWAIEFMVRHGIRHPESKVFDEYRDACRYVETIGGDCVVKADGLTAGKGVFVCRAIPQATTALNTIMVTRAFGAAGDRVVVQERLVGKEASFMAICDGVRALPLVSAQDYKPAFDRDRGPNTGGMGSIAPAPHVKPSLVKKIHRLATLAVEGMREEGVPYRGVLYIGLMIVENEPYVLEFNCRFGDPETQVQLLLLSSDLFPVIEASIDGNLASDMLTFVNKSAVCVVLASDGYPGSFQRGVKIHGLNKIRTPNALTVFHAGTKAHGRHVHTDGGRVVGVTAVAETLVEATRKAYSHIENTIFFEGMRYRKDIGGHLRQRL